MWGCAGQVHTASKASSLKVAGVHRLLLPKDTTHTAQDELLKGLVVEVIHSMIHRLPRDGKTGFTGYSGTRQNLQGAELKLFQECSNTGLGGILGSFSP